MLKTILRDSLLCAFVLFSIVKRSSNCPEFSRNLIIFMFFIFLLVLLVLLFQTPRCFMRLLLLIIMVSTYLANDWSTFFINGKPTFCNGPGSLPRNPPDCIILDSCIFENFMLVDDLFSKALERLTKCLSVNNNLWGKLVSSYLMITLEPYLLHFLSLILIYSAVKLITLHYCVVLSHTILIPK